MTVYRSGAVRDTPVRLVGVTRHWVRGRGVHEHREYETADGREVRVTHWPAQPETRSVVSWQTPDGQHHEGAEPGSVEWALIRTGFEIAAPATLPEVRGPWLGPRPPVSSTPETTSPARPPAHPEGPPA